MELIKQADVVLALGTRLNPFSTLPCYGIDYWPQDAKLIQVDINPDRIGLTKAVTVGIVGDAKQVVDNILSKLSSKAGDEGREKRRNLISSTKSEWAEKLASMDHEDDDDGKVWLNITDSTHGLILHNTATAILSDVDIWKDEATV